MKRLPLTHGGVFGVEEFAQRYARGHQKMVTKFGREYAQKLTQRGFQKGRIIDVGCGFGGTAIFLAKRLSGSEVVGIDLSDPLLQLAEQSAHDAGLNGHVTFEKADVQRIPYEDDTFNVVLNLNLVHLVEDPAKMLDEIERVLVPGGLLFIADLRRSWLGLIEREIKSALTLAEAKELFARSRLRSGSFTSGLVWWRFET